MPRPLIVVAILSVLTLVIVLGHWAVFVGITRFWAISDLRALTHLKIGLGVLALSFVASSVLISLTWNPVARFLYAGSAVWLGTAYWLLVACALGSVLMLLARAMGHEAYGLAAGKALTVAALIVSAYGIWHSYQTRVVRYDVALPGLPASWEGRTVAVVSDTHFGNVRNVGFAEAVARLVKEQDPDMLLIPGDFFDGPPANYAELAAPFGKLKLRRGVFFANGNHEEFSDSAVYDDALSASGVTVLNDAAANVDGLQVVGVNYSTSNTPEDAARTLAAIPLDPSRPAVLIKHAPNALDAVAAAGIDLQVSGHTHGGQVWPGPWAVRKIFGAFAYGKNERGTLTVVTTSGAGTWGPPQRVGTSGEIVLLTLRAR